MRKGVHLLTLATVTSDYPLHHSHRPKLTNPIELVKKGKEHLYGLYVCMYVCGMYVTYVCMLFYFKSTGRVYRWNFEYSS